MPDFKLFKKKSKTPSDTSKEPEMVYSMTPRHGHAQDVFDENNVRQVAGCLPIDPIHKRFLLVTSSSNPGVWVIVSTCYFILCKHILIIYIISLKVVGRKMKHKSKLP